MMDRMDVIFHAKLKKMVEDELVSKRETIANGQLNPDSYKFECGRVRGLMDMLNWCEGIRKEVMRDSND